MMMPMMDHRERSSSSSSSSPLPPDGDMNNNLPWGWVLESLLDVKKLSLPFLQDVIQYVQPLIEQQQCSRLLQKATLRYLDEEEGTVTPRNLDTCDVLFLRFLLKEQGISHLSSRIHSLKESFENDLRLRVETEAVLTNLRDDGKEGRGGDWAAFEDTVDSVFPKDMLEPRRADRRKELTSLRQDRSKGEPEKHLCKEFLGRYPLEELRRDLASFVDDKRELFKFKFLDQVAEDVENGIYSFSPGSESFEPRAATTLPGSIPVPCQNDKRIAIDGDGDTDPRNHVTAGASVSETKDMRAEMLSRMAEVNKVANGLTNEMNELVNDITVFTEDVHRKASIPFPTSDLSNQEMFSLAAPIARNSIVLCPAERAEVHLESDEPVTNKRENIKSADCQTSESLKRCTERDTQQTSRISPERVTKSLANEIIEQVTGVAKRRKLDEVELSEKQRNQSGATGENIGVVLRPNMQKTFEEGPSNYRLSSQDMDIAEIRVIGGQVGKNCSSKHRLVSYDEARLTLGGSNLPAADGGDGELNAKCYFCGSSGGCQAFCYRCSVSIHQGCLSRLSSSPVEVENCWYCFDCSATMAQEGLRKAQEGVKEAKEALRKAEEEVLTTQERLAKFFSAKRERSSEHREGQNICVEFSEGAQCGKVTETNIERKKSMQPEQGLTKDFRPEVEDKTKSSKSGHITQTRMSLSRSSLQGVIEQDTIRQNCRTTQDTKMQTVPQASVFSEGLNAAMTNRRAGQDFPREISDGSTSVPSLLVSQGLPPGDKHTFGYCGEEQSEGPTSSTDRMPPMVPHATDSHTKSGSHDVPNEDVGVPNEDVGAMNVATNGSDVPVDHGGGYSPSHDSPFNTRNPEGEGDGHDGDLEEVCEGNRAAADRINVTKQVVNVISENISEASNLGAKFRPRKVYSGRGLVPGVRRKNLPWTETEEDMLKEGVKIFSRDGEWGFQWRRILEFGNGTFDESRTTGDLKDKWRNLRSKQDKI